MNLNEFFDEIVQQYKQAKAVTAPCQRKHVFRGRQHDISSIAEDLFAALLSDTLGETYQGANLYYRIDYAMRPDLIGTRMFPDIAIIAEAERPVLVSYLDLKTDLGYKRRYFDSFETIQEQVKRLRASRHAGANTYSDTVPNGKEVLISPVLKWRTAVISDCNLSPRKMLEENKVEAEQYAEYFKLYFLSGGCHPNEKHRDRINTYKEEPFRELISDLKKDIEAAWPMITDTHQTKPVYDITTT